MDIQSLLRSNPQISNSALAGVVAANINNFKGHVRVFDTLSPAGPAKMIRISPYGFWQDLLVSIKRIFTGIVFPQRNGDLQSDLAQGRRVILIVRSTDSTEIVEESRKSSVLRLIKQIFCCC